MYARSTTFLARVSSIDEGIAHIRDEVPALSATAAFQRTTESAMVEGDQRRVNAMLVSGSYFEVLSWFSALALAVAAAGLYVAFAHAVTERRREMAIRIAICRRRLEMAPTSGMKHRRAVGRFT